MNTTILSFVTSGISLVGLWLTGNKRVEGFWVGLLNQGLWVWLALATGAYGLLPMAGVFAVIYARNIRKWAVGNR